MNLDPRMSEDFGAWLSLIVWWPIVQAVEGYGPEFGRIVARNSVLQFPDGSVCLSTHEDLMDAWSVLQPHREDGRMRVRQNTMFRSLKCFTQRSYQLLTTAEYFERIGDENDFLVTPTHFGDTIEAGECTPEHLWVRVRFWKTPLASLQPAFIAALEAWEKSVAADRVMGSSSAHVDLASVRFLKRWASFRIDVSHATQDVLNWLILSILNFGSTRQPVSEIRFGENE